MEVIATNGEKVKITQEIIDLIQLISATDFDMLGNMKENCSKVGMYLGKLLCVDYERGDIREKDLKEQLTNIQMVYAEIESIIASIKPKN